MSENVAAISDEQAKAVQELARLGGKGIDAGEKLGAFVRTVFGTVPEDVVGVLGGDWLKIKRQENLVRLAEKATQRLKARGVEAPQPVSPKLALALFKEAADESREGLQDVWARLIAAAMDPNRSQRVRQAFVEVAKRLDPLDAIALQKIATVLQNVTNARSILASQLQVSSDEAQLCIDNLVELGLVQRVASDDAPLTARGREFWRVLSD